MHIGDYFPLSTMGNLLGYRRAYDGKEYMILLNFGELEEKFSPEKSKWKGTVVMTTNKEREGESVSSELLLKPNQGFIISLEA